MMKLAVGMLDLLPKGAKDRMRAPMLARERMKTGADHPTIEMNLTNLLICARNCGTCPSYPDVRGEALYCAGGRSTAHVMRRGCNCVSCPLYDQCSRHNSAYFCINGPCGGPDTGTSAQDISELSARYLERFVHPDPAETEHAVVPAEVRSGEIVPVTIDFIGDQVVNSSSDETILQASLTAGINHTHVCGGRARCSTCRVLVESGVEHLRPRNAAESRLAAIKGFSPDVRLACQTTTTGNVRLRRLVLDDADISEAIQQGRSGQGAVGREVDSTILFADIRSFTSFSETALPYDVVHILNRYFDAICAAIDRNGGYIDKYMGDGIMAIFGLDREVAGTHQFLAVRAAHQMLAELASFNAFLKERYHDEFRIGIGLHSGPVIVGELGFAKKREFTAIGDTVNTASRIEALNKRAGTSVLVSEATHSAIREHYSWKKAFRAEVKGKTEPIVVYVPDFGG
ncbi:MAG: adenylate/guanylate cyclase domain-containing protein [Spirochaetota bacterium]